MTEAPAIHPAGGEYQGSVEVSMDSLEEVRIYYTVDGTEPTTDSTRYTVPFTLTETTTVRAFGIMLGMLPSAEVTETYTITP